MVAFLQSLRHGYAVPPPFTQRRQGFEILHFVQNDREWRAAGKSGSRESFPCQIPKTGSLWWVWATPTNVRTLKSKTCFAFLFALANIGVSQFF